MYVARHRGLQTLFPPRRQQMSRKSPPRLNLWHSRVLLYLW